MMAAHATCVVTLQWKTVPEEGTSFRYHRQHDVGRIGTGGTCWRGVNKKWLFVVPKAFEEKFHHMLKTIGPC